MDIVKALTVAKLTPSGYYNLSEEAPIYHRNFMTWFNNTLSMLSTNSADFKKLILTPWLVNHPDSPRTPWLQYLLNIYGFGSFSGTNNQAAALYRLVSSAWSTSSLFNFSVLTQALCMPPFSWFTSSSIYVGNLVASIMDTGFLIYSTSATPAAPDASTYTPRSWVAPAGWSKTASSALSYSRGYISGTTIAWCAPRPISDFENNYLFSAGVPIAVASEGTIVVVNDDGTGDKGSSYYSDGTTWRKTSTTNSDLGIINTGGRPLPEAITVWAPNPSSVDYAIDSNTPPPAEGGTQGFGTFASWSETAVANNELTITVTQISGGYIAISSLIAILRRIKPIGKSVKLVIDGITYEILDARQK